MVGFTPRPLGGIFCFIETGTSLELRWKRVEGEELEGSGFVSVGRVVEEEAMVVDWGGEGERVGAREVLVDMGEINIVSSFKDKTCKCLLNEEGFIPNEVGGSMCCSN